MTEGCRPTVPPERLVQFDSFPGKSSAKIFFKGPGSRGNGRDDSSIRSEDEAKRRNDSL